MINGAIRRIVSSLPRRAVRRLLAELPASVGENISFEARSKLGRSRARPLELEPDEKAYINLGSGPDRVDGFVAVDFFGAEGTYGADLRYPLLIADNVVDGIFSEHTLEHLNYDQVARLLSECHRILKPGCRIRIVLPDVSLFARHYAQGNESWFKTWEEHVLIPRGRSLVSPMMAISFVTQEYGHRSAWDMDTLGKFLSRAGFVDVVPCSFGEGAEQKLIKDNASPDRTWVSLYAEAVKKK